MKRILTNYCVDRIIYTGLIFLNSILIILFYKLTVGKEIEILYPISITLFFMGIFLIYDFIKYLIFNRDIQNILKDETYKIRYFSREQKEVVNNIKKLNDIHIKEKSQLLDISKDKIHFLANAIHKLKNYVSVIALIIDRAKEKNILEGQILIDIEEENNNLESSLEQILSFIKMDKYENDLDIVVVDIVKEVKDIINNNKSKFINNEIFPVFQFNEPVFVCTDIKWNRIIINQIITNAIKYTISKNDRRVYFNICEYKDKITLEIIDGGIGIPEYDLKRIYDAFFTGENGRKIRNSTGIGLFIASRLCKKLRHSIHIESKEGIGTKVEISYLKNL